MVSFQGKGHVVLLSSDRALEMFNFDVRGEEERPAGRAGEDRTGL